MFENHLNFLSSEFTVIVEIVPPSSSDFGILTPKLNILKHLPINGFNIATNPLAEPKMDSLSSSFLIQNYMKKPTILHCTTRDQNQIGIQATLWGAKALNITTVIVMTGDLVPSKNDITAKVVQDIDVLSLITTARTSGLYTGIVIGDIDNSRRTIDHFKDKVKAGAQFVVTQPVYSFEEVAILKQITADSNIPLIMGIMPLQNIHHAKFISEKVKGISIPHSILKRISCAEYQLEEGIVIASEILRIAHKYFNGVCIMPPLTLNGFNMLPKVFEKSGLFKE